MAALLNHVAVIICGSTYKEMVRIYTETVIAMMANKKPGRDDPLMDFPRGSVCPNHSMIPIYLSIPIPRRPTAPYPTRLCLVNLIPEPLYKATPCLYWSIKAPMAFPSCFMHAAIAVPFERILCTAISHADNDTPQIPSHGCSINYLRGKVNFLRGKVEA